MATVLITGASAGLGEEFAWQLAGAGHDVILVARNRERLESLAASIRSAAAVDVEVLPADLSADDGLNAVAGRLQDKTRPVSLLVNNAGFGLGQDFVTGDLEHEEKALAVMVRAVMTLSHAAAGPMLERGRGAIINVSSIASLLASGTYSAHKAWVRTFTEALAVEFAGTGVTATALCPGLTRTEFHARAGYKRTGPGLIWLNADHVVATALADVRRGAVISTPGLVYKVFAGVIRFSPRWLLRRVQRRVPALR